MGLGKSWLRGPEAFVAHWTLAVRLISMWALICRAEPPAAKPDLPVFRSISQVRRLKTEEANRGYPVRLRGVVTYYDFPHGDLFVQDGGEAIYVEPGGTPLPLHAGRLIEVEGISRSCYRHRPGEDTGHTFSAIPG